eukprot:COSAG04_NODE_14645_length_560_cov_1.271150_1_plen_80_part_10
MSAHSPPSFLSQEIVEKGEKSFIFEPSPGPWWPGPRWPPLAQERSSILREKKGLMFLTLGGFISIHVTAFCNKTPCFTQS